jgi:hypothetical protein
MDYVGQGQGQEIDEATFDMLRRAVRMAREHQLGSVAALRAKLVAEHPGDEPVIERALVAWASREAALAAQG